MNTLEIFKPGRHTAMSGAVIDFTEADLEATAAAYDPKLHEAPLVVGHPKLDAPAYGWVGSLAYSGTLDAGPVQVDPAFAEMVKAGRFKKISASFYAPNSKDNPKPGVYYLRHIGFLGAQPPAVKGLKNASFAGGEEGVIEFGDSDDMQNASMWRRLREWIISKFGLDEANKVIPDYAVANLEDAARADDDDETDAPEAGTAPVYAEPSKQETEMDKQKEASLAAREKAVNDKEANFAERAKKLADQERAAARKDIVEFVEARVKEGKILPRDQAPLVEFMAALDRAAVIEFAEGSEQKKVPGAEWLRGFLSNLPKAIEYAERAAAEDNATAAAVKAVKAPEGYAVHPERAEIHAKALSYAEHNKVDYLTAVRAVEGQ